MPSELIEGRGITYPNQPYYIRFPYQGPSPGVYREYSVEQRERLIAASAEGRIAAGGNIACPARLHQGQRGDPAARAHPVPADRPGHRPGAAGGR
ncbi:hypothetical protein NB693_20830, partial [Pantoea ananatis]|uniref:hypothetical protein n=1 Tax=Pantoea ananas TaxID=553 RepID=UPI00221EE59C|nr:hypothetical protein [Pantoea ananatis]